MKTFFIAAASFLCCSLASKAQSTVDSIEAKYKLQPMPEALTLQKAFPAIGTYQMSGATSGAVTVAMDSTNKGIVTISGLPEGTMKAYLKKSPSTYRIIPQKTDLGKTVPEGTMIFSPESNTLNIVLGTPYNETDPGSVFSMNAASATDAGGINSTSTSDAMATTSPKKTVIKTKNSTAKTKTKFRPVFYTATKTDVTTTSASTPVQQ